MRFIAVLTANYWRGIMKARGFTLIELTIVIIILSVVAGIVWTSLPSTAVFQAEASSAQLINDLNLTKSLSMGRNERYRIVIGTSSYQIQNSAGTPIVHPGNNASSILYPTGVTITPTGTTIFDSMGKPYNGSSVALSSPLVLTVTNLGLTHTVSIIPETGFIQ